MADSGTVANGRSNTLTLGYLARYVTSTSQLPRKVSKFLLAYVMLFNASIFGNISCACAKEYLIAARY